MLFIEKQLLTIGFCSAQKNTYCAKYISIRTKYFQFDTFMNLFFFLYIFAQQTAVGK